MTRTVEPRSGSDLDFVADDFVGGSSDRGPVEIRPASASASSLMTMLYDLLLIQAVQFDTRAVTVRSRK
jgi:hypothetical protein